MQWESESVGSRGWGRTSQALNLNLNPKPNVVMLFQNETPHSACHLHLHMWGREPQMPFIRHGAAAAAQCKRKKREKEKNILNWMAAREGHYDERPGVEGVAGRKLNLQLLARVTLQSTVDNSG